jgi:hypothetical protein
MFGYFSQGTENLNFTDIYDLGSSGIAYSSVVQPCRHSPQVATRDFNVATANCSEIDF